MCRSAADSQLLLHLPFKQTVRLTALTLDAPEDAAPTLARLYVNRPTLGFEDLEDVEPTQVRAGARCVALRVEWLGDGGSVTPVAIPAYH